MRSAFLALIALCLLGANIKLPPYGVSESRTIGSLQPAALRKDRCYHVYDALTVDDCTTGGGTFHNICCSDGTAYQSLRGTPADPNSSHGDGANCLAGNAPLGVDAQGAVQDCFDTFTQVEANAHIADPNAHHGPVTECATAPCDLDPNTTLGGAAVQTGVDDDIPELGDFGKAALLDPNGRPSGIDADGDGTTEFFVINDQTPAGDLHGPCLNIEDGDPNIAGNTSLCYSATYNDPNQITVSNGFCQTVGYMTGDKTKQNILECVFDPENCMDGAGGSYCNDELQAFFDAVDAWVQGDDNGLGDQNWGVRYRFTHNFIDLDLKASPVYVKPDYAHFDCTAHPFFRLEADPNDGSIKTDTTALASISVTAGDFAVTGAVGLCGADYDPNDIPGTCANEDDPIKAGMIVWKTSLPDETYIWQRTLGDTTGQIAPEAETTSTAEAWTASTSGAFYIGKQASFFTMSGRCRIGCGSGDRCRVVDNLGAPIANNRTMPVTTIIAGGSYQIVDGFEVWNMNHKNDYCIGAVSEATNGSQVMKVLGGLCNPAAGNEPIMRYLRTGANGSDATDNGRGASFFNLAGGTRIGGIAHADGGGSGTCILQINNSIGSTFDADCENSGRVLWVPDGATEVEMVVNTSEHDLNTASAESDLGPLIDIGASATTQRGSYQISWGHITMFSAERPLMQIEDPNSSVFISGRLQMDSDAGDVIQTAASGVKLSGELHCWDGNSDPNDIFACTLDPDLILAGFTLCQDLDECQTYSQAFTSDATADPADTGSVRLGNAESICWEAAPTGTDVCLTVGVQEQLVATGGFIDGDSIADNEIDDTEIQDESLGTADILNGSLLEVDLDANNAPTDNFVLSYHAASGGFTWVADQQGSSDPNNVVRDGTVAANQIVVWRDTGVKVQASTCTVINGEIDCPAHATDGGCHTFKEGVDDGTQVWQICLPNAGLNASLGPTTTCIVDPNSGRIPDSCVGDGVDGGGASLTVEESDGAPSIASVSTLQFDPNDGFVVSGGAGTAKVDSEPTGTKQLTYRADRDKGGTEPADGAGFCIEGGTGDVCFLYEDTANENQAQLTGAAGGYDMDGPLTATSFTADSVAGQTSYIYLFEDPNNGTNKVGFQAPASIALDEIWILPATDSTGSQCLASDGSNNLSWVACGADPNAALGNAWTTIGTATADTDTDVMTITDTPAIDLITANDPEDLSADFVYSNEKDATDIAMAADECVFRSDLTGGGFVCEGSAADPNEQEYLFPDINDNDAVYRIAVDDKPVTDLEGTNLSIAGGVLNATDTDTTCTDVACTVDLANDTVTQATANRCARFDPSGNLVVASADCASGDTDTDTTCTDVACTVDLANDTVTQVTANRCARFDASGNLVVASGDCTAGDTDTDTDTTCTDVACTVDLANDTVTQSLLNRCARFDGSGNLAAHSGDCASGTGDVSDVGDCISDDCFTANGTGNQLFFEGATADAFETLLTAADPNVDRTITLPNATGTVSLEPDLDTTCTDVACTVDLANDTVTQATANRCARFDASGDLVVASGDCTAGDTDTDTDTTCTDVACTVDLANDTVTQALTDRCARFDASGNLVAHSGDCASGTGDVSDVGDCISDDCFTANGTGNQLFFEGATADAFETLLTAADPNVDRTITLPNASGTVSLEPDLDTTCDTGDQACTFDDDAITLIQSAAPAPTIEGRIEWDTDEYLVVGDGAAGNAVFVPAENITGDASMTDAGSIEVTQADALELDPADCGANQYAHTIAANGNLTCSQPALDGLSNVTETGESVSKYLGNEADGSWAPWTVFPVSGTGFTTAIDDPNNRLRISCTAGAADGSTRGCAAFNATRFSGSGVIDIASVAGITGANEDNLGDNILNDLSNVTETGEGVARVLAGEADGSWAPWIIKAGTGMTQVNSDPNNRITLNVTAVTTCDGNDCNLIDSTLGTCTGADSVDTSAGGNLVCTVNGDDDVPEKGDFGGAVHLDPNGRLTANADAGLLDGIDSTGFCQTGGSGCPALAGLSNADETGKVAGNFLGYSATGTVWDPWELKGGAGITATVDDPNNRITLDAGATPQVDITEDGSTNLCDNTSVMDFGAEFDIIQDPNNASRCLIGAGAEIFMPNDSIPLDIQDFILNTGHPLWRTGGYVVGTRSQGYLQLPQNTTGSSALYMFRMPRSWGSSLVAKVFYTTSTASALKVDLEIEMMTVPTGGTFTTESFGAKAEVTGGIVLHNSTSLMTRVDIPIADTDEAVAYEARDSLIIIRVTRNEGDGDDTYADNFRIQEIALEWDRESKL